MPGKAVLFLIGCWGLHWMRALPPWPVVVLAAAAALLLSRRLRAVVPLFWLVAGFSWAALSAHWRTPPAPPPDVIETDLPVRLEVVGLPVSRAGITRFEAVLRPLDAPAGAFRARLWWRGAPSLRPGQRFEGKVRLRPVRGYHSAGAFDVEARAWRQGRRLRGQVIEARPLTGSEGACCLVDRWRLALRERIWGGPEPRGSGEALAAALLIGDRSGIDAALRDALARTGTAHLLAISGLHIGLAALLGGGLSGLLWRRTPLAERVPARLAGGLAGLVVATGYALLSGLGLPALRALLMVAAATVMLWARRPVASFDTLALALFGVLIRDPMAVTSAGFWLSFVAVAAILAVWPHLRGRPPLLRWVLLQSAVSLALYPVLLAFSLPPAPLGLPINLLLVPLFGLIVPALFLALFALPLSELPWQGVIRTLDALSTGLRELAAWPVPSFVPAVTPWALVLLVLGVAWLLAPPGWPVRAAGLLLLLAGLRAPAPALPQGGFRLAVLDVGQGQSVVISTRTRHLVFDAGPAYASGFDLSRAVVLPWLRRHGIDALDALVLSHGDRDHAGGAAGLLRALPVATVRSGEPGRLRVPAEPCRSGTGWRWDGVGFRFVQPDWARGRRGNDASCVLLVEGRFGRALVTGDAGHAVERALIATGVLRQPVDLVVAGHHGSRTASSPAFVRAVGAKNVIYSVGFRNRYGFPRPVVDARWAHAGARRWRTDGCGTVEAVFDADGTRIDTWIRQQRRFWTTTGAPCTLAPHPSVP